MALLLRTFDALLSLYTHTRRAKVFTRGGSLAYFARRRSGTKTRSAPRRTSKRAGVVPAGSPSATMCCGSARRDAKGASSVGFARFRLRRGRPESIAPNSRKRAADAVDIDRIQVEPAVVDRRVLDRDESAEMIAVGDRQLNGMQPHAGAVVRNRRVERPQILHGGERTGQHREQSEALLVARLLQPREAARDADAGFAGVVRAVDACDVDHARATLRDRCACFLDVEAESRACVRDR